MTAALVIENLHKTYVRKAWLGKRVEKPVLRGIDLTLEEGKVLGLVGESGCGKSTLCKVILGIEPITSGTVQVAGVNINGLSTAKWRDLRRKMQVVYQDPYASLDPRFTVRQLVSEPLDIHKLYMDKSARENYLRELLNSVQLDVAFLDRYPHEFSGGQRQRIAIARALALEPQILIADEPVSALDVSVQAQILNLLKDIAQKRQLSMLFVTHDFAVARFLCDDIAVMHQGKIVEYAPAEELFAQPRQAYTQKLLSAVPTVPRGAL
ncbi:MAG: ABC transporter ATP-binding protein [Elusimicrobiaceae bacterium]|nr:ABC transporter ATP-binding protein [Elusimicrobiaceae bacterium]MBP5616463.1 ABC transporter ATP-binding protein [Elusimicrobiaceae bacterium]